VGAFDETLDRSREFVLGWVSDFFDEPAPTEGDSPGGDDPTPSSPDSAPVSDQVERWILKFEASLKNPLKENRGKVGPLAVLVLVITSLSLYRTAERTFAKIWNVKVRAGYIRKLGTFWLLLTAIPLILGTSFITQPMSIADNLGWLTSIIREWVVPVVITICAFTLILTYLPNTRVQLSAAIGGAFLAGLAWQIGTRTFFLYVQQTFRGGPFGQLEGVYWILGTIPLFLFWVYFSWLIALVGAEISYCLQNCSVLEREVRFNLQEERMSRPVLALLSLERVYRGYRGQPGPITCQEIATEFQIPVHEIEGVVEVLR
jgi:membrane protein